MRNFFDFVGGGPDDDGEELSVHSEDEEVLDTEDTEDDEMEECLSASTESDEMEDESERRDCRDFLAASILVGRFAAAEPAAMIELCFLFRWPDGTDDRPV